ncbi:restriction endonuclease subunit S [Streptomyces sp. MP131-18]|uniref:restriction endonuclease subunit S n=1 Tax=Streptomyces sp. MP131-18 TaxID=1857892 RepID=UPI00097C68BF|nr:restriction endonuclease subunit S [Streptomyces sp. MP131-18]ONK12036.1 Type I restriction enzyme EcoKI specificity protein [Streptomyces sp. MP131-18]
MSSTELPPGWAWATLGDLGKWYGGGTPSKSRPDFWTDGTIPWLSPKDMGPESITATQDHITDAAVRESATRLVPPGSVTIVTRSGILERFIPVAYVSFATTLNQDMKALHPHEGVTPHWIAWCLRAFESDILRNCRKAGTTVASLSTKALMNCEVPIAPPAEQRRIIEALEGHLSRLDASDSLLHSCNARTNSLVTGTMAASLRQAHAQAVRLDEVAEVRLGRQRSPKNHSGDQMRSYLRAANVGWDGLRLGDVKKMNFSDTEAEIYRLHPGDILLTEASGSAGEVGKAAIWNGEINDCSFQNTLLRVRASEAVSPAYLHHFLRHEALRGAFRASTRGVGIHHLGAAKLAAWPVPLPPPGEQSRIVRTIEETSFCVEKLRNTLQGASDRSRSLRKALLDRAFSGRLVPQDPDDEPASVLLDRIRAEREAEGPKRRRTPRPRKAATPPPPPPASSTPLPAQAVQQEFEL